MPMSTMSMNETDADKKKESKTAELLGEYMLRGWSLLGQTCPACNNTPLVQYNRKNPQQGGTENFKIGDMFCVTCNCPVRYEKDVTLYTETQSSAIPTNNPPSPSMTVNEDVILPGMKDVDIPKNYDELRAEFESSSSKKRDNVSVKLGEYMLKGWTMLGTSCPIKDCAGTPLMKSRKNDVMMCVCCDRTFMDKDGQLEIINIATNQDQKQEKNIETNESETISVVKTPPTVASSPVINDGINFEDEFPVTTPSSPPTPILPPRVPDMSDNGPSSILAQKLLLGWSMLEQVCNSEQCKGHVPLMRDRKGTTKCVICEVDDAPVKKATAAASTTPSSETLIGNRKKLTSNDDLDDDADNVVQQYMKQRKAELSSNVSKNYTTETTKTVTRINDSNSIALALNAMDKRMCDTAAELEICADITRSNQLVDFIIKLDGAMKQLGSI